MKSAAPEGNAVHALLVAPVVLLVTNPVNEERTVKCLQVGEFEDTKGVITNCKSKDRQHNGQTKNDKRTNNDLKKHYTEH